MKRERTINRLVLVWRVFAVAWSSSWPCWWLQPPTGTPARGRAKVTPGANGTQTISSPAKGFAEPATPQVDPSWLAPRRRLRGRRRILRRYQ